VRRAGLVENHQRGSRSLSDRMAIDSNESKRRGKYRLCDLNAACAILVRLERYQDSGIATSRTIEQLREKCETQLD
jgi:hypothetical protein